MARGGRATSLPAPPRRFKPCQAGYGHVAGKWTPGSVASAESITTPKSPPGASGEPTVCGTIILLSARSQDPDKVAKECDWPQEVLGQSLLPHEDFKCDDRADHERNQQGRSNNKIQPAGD